MPSDTTRPNILWIGLDQIRFDTPGCNGNSVCRTPNTDRLAASGVNFTGAYTPSSLCTPARASMFTGLFAFTNGMGTNCDMYHSLAAELPDPGMLLHPRLQQAGYRCGYVGKWHVGTEKGPVDYGFEGMNGGGYGNLPTEPEFIEYLEANGLSYEIRDRIHINADEKMLMAGVWDGRTESTPPHYLAERTIEMMEQYAAGDQPFFLTCQFWGPHGPHLPSREYAGMHDRDAIEPWESFDDDGSGKPAFIRRMRDCFFRPDRQGWADWREVVGLYYDFTAMIDAEIGRILDRLEQLGLAGNTVIVFTTDHGDMTGSHGRLTDKGLMYQEAHRIPLIVAWPGQFAGGRTCDELVYNMDVFPTLLDVLGMPDSSLDGVSFLPVLRGEDMPDPREDLLLEFHGIRYLYSQRGLVTRDGWKYIFTPGDNDEVYDLTTDPAELHNRIDDPACAEKVAELRERLKRAVVAARDPLMDCVYKYFGFWESPSGQPDCSRRQN